MSAMEDGTPEAGAALLERALGYALCAVRPVTPAALSRPTPCSRWDLRALLWHTNDSLAALYEGIEDGHIGPGPPVPVQVGERDGHRAAAREATDDPAAAFRTRASRLMGAWAAADGPAGRLVAVDGLPLTAAVLARTGALEIAVHGWDIAQATGLPRPVPAALATGLLRTARQLVPRPAARQPLFGAPVTVPSEADPSDRLVAFLGRDPYGGRPGGAGGGRGGRGGPERDLAGSPERGRECAPYVGPYEGPEGDGRDGAEGHAAPA